MLSESSQNSRHREMMAQRYVYFRNKHYLCTTFFIKMLHPVKEKIILGIDPGTNLMGYGVIKVVGIKASMLAMGVID